MSFKYKIRNFWFNMRTSGFARQVLSNAGWMCSFFVLFNFLQTFAMILLVSVAITYAMREIWN